MAVNGRLRSGGLAVWSIRHPVGTVMIALAVVILGLSVLDRLAVDLLPKLIYPQIRVRIIDAGVSAKVMEDQVTRQLEEQLAITEDAIHVESKTIEGTSTVSLSFPYGKDIDVALRDASTRLDRAKRFLPDTIDSPIIYKLDPSQIPIAEYVLSSIKRDPVALRTWADDVFAKFFLNLPGVAAIEVGGGLVREIHVVPDQHRLAGLGLTINDVVNAIDRGNVDQPGGRLTLPGLEFGSRTAGRLESLEQLRQLPISTHTDEHVRLSEVAQVIDAHEDNRLRVRLNGVPGVKISVQKQPDANTVDVADVVQARMAWLRTNQLIPEDMRIDIVADQSTYVRNALRNATYAAVMGALLAMIVVYLFLGSLRRTLIIGTAIPISIMVTFAIMGAGGLTLNIMTLGGLALGVGLLVDNTIVMLENMTRHQQQGELPLEAGRNAAAEVTSAIVASTSTNLAAVLPFLFIGGLVALLFRELIFTISAAILASMVVALTLVPSLAAHIERSGSGWFRDLVDRLMNRLSGGYGAFVVWILTGRRYWILLSTAVLALVLVIPVFTSDKREFLPRLDDGRVRVDITADPSRSVDDMDDKVRRIEQLIWDQDHVQSVFTVVGGYIFGRTERQVSNRTTLKVQLVSRANRPVSNREWVRRFGNAFRNAEIAGIKMRSRARSIRGLRFGRSEQEISVRVQGPELSVLNQLAGRIAVGLNAIPGLKNVEHTAEEVRQEFAITVDRERIADLGVDVAQVGEQVRIALQGVVASDFLEGDRAYPILVRLPRTQFEHPEDLDSVLLFPVAAARSAIYLGDVAEVELVPAPLELHRDNQHRIIEVTAAPKASFTLGQVIEAVRDEMSMIDFPPGYAMYFGGAEESLQKGQGIATTVLSLALFLVFVVLAVQYESLRNPLVIMLCVPFTVIGVAIGLVVADLPLSMPIWLGLIMLAGIVVNNSIVLVEYIEILRERGEALQHAIAHAARLRLRPILMTTLTTVVGMSPLALGLGEGAEMLQPLAVTIVAGLAFAMIVSLGLVPAVYLLVHQIRRAGISSMSPAAGAETVPKPRVPGHRQPR